MSPAEFQRCPQCRALNEPRALFCSRCGASLYGPAHGGRRRPRRRISAAGAAMALAILIVLAAAVFTLSVLVDRALAPTAVEDTSVGQSGTTATLGGATTSSTTRVNSTTDTSPGQSASQIRPTTASASSTLKATATNNYGATNLLDGDVTTAWNEGADGLGMGEWVRFTFAGPTVLSRIEIANGYQKDEQRFEGNPRVQTLRIEYSNNTTQLVDLLDTVEFQSVTPTRQPVEWVKIVIVSVYPGAEWEDAALSEVRFYGAIQ